jgi:membrane glycosyltransferase
MLAGAAGIPPPIDSSRMSPSPQTTETVEETPAFCRPPRQPSSGPVKFLFRTIFFGCALALASGATLVFADLLWRTYGSFSGAMILLVILFGALFGLVSLGFVHAFFGFLALPFRRVKSINIAARLTNADLQAPFDRTAIVFPVYNEEVERVYAGLRAVYQSLQRAGRLEDFEFFILSDSTNSDNWVREEFAWSELCRELDGFGKIFYRKRVLNTNKKAGNIADFCRTWGGRYTYMIVMDADSVMEGGDVIKMAALMQKHPQVGLLQTAPRVVNGDSIFGRMQQFANRLYGPMFTAGLNLWQQSEGNYWGHNAIIRVQPFTDWCDLPDLPGKEPFGGKILSHDFVEAALMRKAGWEVWLAWDLEGTYEEGPQSILESAQRDRRWLQGNLQHTWLLFARGLHPANKVHLFMGIMGYLASPLWFAFLLVGTLVIYQHKASGLTVFPADGLFSRWFPEMDLKTQGLALFFGTMGILFSPKVFALIQAIFAPRFRKGLGGLPAIATGMVLETIFSTLIAPVFMLFHSKFLLWMVLGRAVNWSTQVRGAVGTGWKQAASTHAGHTLVGLGWLGLCAWIDIGLLIWMTPVLAGMVLSIPVSVWSSRPGPGHFLRKIHLLLTPDETRRPRELIEIDERIEARAMVKAARPRFDNHEGITRAVIDPYANAVHVSLLDAKTAGLEHEENLALAERLVLEGPSSLNAAEIRRLLYDAEIILSLHRRIWTTPDAELASWWSRAIAQYRRAA